jgi:pyruvate/2-oxoglutarate dehydrogenase complex dihydrolipoamide dehydrogenase (E3) component
MSDQFDVIVLGMGPGGEVAASRLLAPIAGEWIHQAALAIRALVPLDMLRDQVAQFPTYTEAYLTGLEQLDA